MFEDQGVESREPISELTEDQSAGDRLSSQKLSMQATTPPSEVPGYRLERFLGSGAFGQVWVGCDLNTGRPVAIKFFLHRGGVNWSLLSHEVKNLVQLSADRNIVQVLEVGWDNDPPYYVMELVTGGSLEDELKRCGTLTADQAVVLFRKICVGLNHSHSKGVLHCDLKPANILLGEDHEPRLADFGQSRMTDDQTPALGTLFYMAPEQASVGSSPSTGWDVYAAGAIMYRMVTGNAPYRTQETLDHLDAAGSLPKRLECYRHSIQQSPPPQQHLQTQGVDRLMGQIISRCIAADPRQRFTNVQEIIDALDRRDQVRLQRPLMLLGVLGPMLLLIATAVFAFRTVDNAVDRTRDALHTEAEGSNQLAAKFAARTLENELDRYFRLSLQETSKATFQQHVRDALQDPPLKQALDEIAAAGTSREARQRTQARDVLLDSASRLKLNEYFQSRLQNYLGAPETAHVPRLATIFVTDPHGTIVAIAYKDPVSREQDSSGRNYAYRTYYHGLENDLEDSTPIASIQPLSNIHLSSAFQSTATGLWKIAISLPVYFDRPKRLVEGEPTDDLKRKPDAVFVATINLGEIELLQSEQKDKVAVLLDARQGNLQGTVLQHPWMESDQGKAAVREGARFQVEPAMMSALLDGQNVAYTDPIAKVDDSEDYQGEWIAAMQPVWVPESQAIADSRRRSPEDRKSGLLVLVQYHLSAVLSPVRKMRDSLIWEGSVAVVAIFLVSVTLWFWVRRGNRPGNRRLATEVPQMGRLRSTVAAESTSPLAAESNSAESNSAGDAQHRQSPDGAELTETIEVEKQV